MRFEDCTELDAPEIVVVIDQKDWGMAEQICSEFGGQSMGFGLLFFADEHAKLMFMLKYNYG